VFVLFRGTGGFSDLYKTGIFRERVYIRNIRIKKLGNTIVNKLDKKLVDIVGTASRVPRVTLALACSEGLYTLSHPVASSLIHIQYQPEYYTYL
jgi:hypothetical protein